VRIAHIDAEQGFSGGEAQVFLLIEGLRELGHEGVVVCPPGSRSDAEAHRRGFRALTVPMANDLDVAAVGELRQALVRCQPDLVHFHTGRATWLAGLAARTLSLPAITTRRMDKPIRRGWRQRITYGPLVARAVAVSRSVQNALLEGGVAPEKVSVIHDAVDARAVEPSCERACTRSALEASETSIVLLVTAALVRRKGVDVLLEALARARSKELVLWIAGDGPERNSLDSLAEFSGLADRVRFLGRREDVPDLLHACDVLVLPSRREGLGVSALEAMAAKRPVVASRVGGLAEAVVDGRTGILVPPEDADALARAVDRIATDRGLRLRLGEAGPARISEGFLASQMAAAYDRLYRRVLEERANPGQGEETNSGGVPR
jgi:glycosyltransferase involved in cell wall biosynthesis